MIDVKTLNMVKAMTYAYPDEIPVNAGFLPMAWLKYGDKLKELKNKYPDVIGDAPEWKEYNMPQRFYPGLYKDGWNCVWENKIKGMEAYVTGHPVRDESDMLSLKAPAVDMGLPHGFMYLRILDLMGFENAMIEFALESDGLKHVIDTVCEYNCGQIKKEIKKLGDYPVITFGDDLGMQTGLAIGAVKWRKLLKPAFKKMYSICHAAGKLVFMHTDGCIKEIMPDLKECGVDMINPQFRANGLDDIEKTCKGKIPICLDLDRQMYPFATPAQLKEHVESTVRRLYLKEGGLALNLEFGADVPLENIDAVLGAVNTMRFYKG